MRRGVGDIRMVGSQVYEWNPDTNQWTQLEQVQRPPLPTLTFCNVLPGTALHPSRIGAVSAQQPRRGG